MPEHTPAPSPHRAVYGFAIYVLFFTLFILYALWALLPTEQMGLTYLPDKYLALVLPFVILTGLAMFIFFIYPSISACLTPDVDEISSVVDVALVQRLSETTETSNITSWKQLKCFPSVQEQSSYDNDENCALCNVKHRRSNLKPVATLRFMDLEEINQQVFGT